MTYDGGKNGEGVWQTIINQMPPHRAYVELFLGSGAVMRRKRPAPELNIGVEIDPVTAAAVRPEMTAVDVIEGCALEWLRREGMAAAADVLIYADPPYLLTTRSQQRDLYRREFGGPAEHTDLLTLLDRTKALAVISGYRSSLYDELLPEPKWRRLDFVAGSRGGPRLESLWMNFPDPAELHDYRYLGKNRTQRQRIRRKLHRWQTRLTALPALERAALLSALLAPAAHCDYARG